MQLEKCPNKFCPGHLRPNDSYARFEGDPNPPLHCDTCGKTAYQAKRREQEIIEAARMREAKQPGRVMPRTEIRGIFTEAIIQDVITKAKEKREVSMEQEFICEKCGASFPNKRSRGQHKRGCTGQAAQGAAASPAPRTGRGVKLPALPDFSADWPMETQVAWLNNVSELYREGMKV
jgi:hypothetical protein